MYIIKYMDNIFSPLPQIFKKKNNNIKCMFNSDSRMAKITYGGNHFPYISPNN